MSRAASLRSRLDRCKPLAQGRSVRTVTAVRRLGRPFAAFWAGPLLVCAAIAGPAEAAPPATAPPRLDLSRLASPYDAGQALKAAGIAHTSLDRSLLNNAATASLGFLCGGPPSTGTSGAAGALGYDSDGRFLGAQLRFGFH